MDSIVVWLAVAGFVTSVKEKVVGEVVDIGCRVLANDAETGWEFAAGSCLVHAPLTIPI